MEARFWHDRWQANEIAFHEHEVNPVLVRFFDKLLLPQGKRIFVPLCGKTLDIGWLLAKGYDVVGVELSELAVEQLFAELGMPATVSDLGKVKRYSAKGIDILVGDIFEVCEQKLGSVDAVYDRAALVALPIAMRHRYSEHLMAITLAAPQLLICFEYDQNRMEGPPFSISEQEVYKHYGQSYDLRLMTSQTLAGGLKGESSVRETVWLLAKLYP